MKAMFINQGVKSVWWKSIKSVFLSFVIVLFLKRHQREFPSPARPPRRDAHACGRNIVSGGEVGGLHDWRLRSDVDLFS